MLKRGIVHTLAKFGSLVLVTVTVTRKMLSMVFSVVAFGHSLSHMQKLGVSMVFSGIGAEAWIKSQSDATKKKAAAEKRAADITENSNGSAVRKVKN